MRKIVFCILILFAPGMASVSCMAGGKPAEELADIIHRIYNTDGYAYEFVVTSVLKDKPADKEVQKYLNYSSREQFISYSGSDESVVFIDSNGMFRVDLQHKQAYYTQFDDNARRQWRKYIDQSTAGMADSVLLHDVRVVSKTGKSTVTYKLKYAPDALMKEMNVVYNTASQSLKKISYAIERPMSNNEAMVKQVVVMDHYRQQMPPVVQTLLSQTTDIHKYLKQTYPGYTIQKI